MTVSTTPRRSPVRDLALDSVRGVAIILMVLGHVIGADASTGLKTTNAALHFSVSILADIRMPLFTVLSGYVYALRPAIATRTGFASLLRGKVKRLLLPLAATGTVFMLVQALTPGTNSATSLSDMWQVYLLGSGHFWFLQALFLIFITVGILDLTAATATSTRMAITLIVASALSLLGPITHATVFSWGKALHYLPFFLLGAGLKRFWDAHTPVWPFVPLTLIGLAARTATLTGLWTPSHTGNLLLMLTIGICGTWGLIGARRFFAWRPLAALGWFSYPIYLMHVFGTAASRIVLRLTGLDSLPLTLSAGLLAGLLLPILITVTAGRSERFSRLFLGQARYRGLPQFTRRTQ